MKCFHKFSYVIPKLFIEVHISIIISIFIDAIAPESLIPLQSVI